MNDNLALYYFHQGTNYFSYEYLGCNLVSKSEIYTYSFRVWAPCADSVSLVSDFSGWDEGRLPLRRISEKGVWELIYTSRFSLDKQPYKFAIRRGTSVIMKGDAYARFSRGLDDGASLVYVESSYKWQDHNWMKYRKCLPVKKDMHYIPHPVNIYEVHLESFIKRANGTCLSYTELAEVLCGYVKSMGYTHVELMPITEYPYSGSWGYQVGAYFAPTSRFGDPDDFKRFVDAMHRVGVGVIIDWVPAHFPKDEWGLYEYDGSPLYEYQGEDRMESRSWGTRFFDVGREEVQSFLISSALYFLREYHVDGLRIDAVASMLYLDYDREPGEWIPNCEGGNVNLEVCAFFAKLNRAVFSEFPEVMMIAEESGSRFGITTPVDEGGLGFNMKWNMGWANDLYDYLSSSPAERIDKHKALNFPIMYAFTENFCLPISHDEVVHGKRSFIDKMYGTYEDKFKQMRAALLFMMTFPGKKLTFMGTEFAQYREWDHSSSLEWFMLDYPTHSSMQKYTQALNHFYLKSPELWEIDFDSYGFEWILADEAEKCTIAYRRYSADRSSLITLINFSDKDQIIRLPVRRSEYVEVLFQSDPEDEPMEYVTLRERGGYYINVCVKRYSGSIMKEKIRKKTFKV